ncbi:MAG: DUF748 domain-containing protein [Methylococcales bacterium]|nr:DUF748 domain-containing protein [Methylococcales bacterium]
MINHHLLTKIVIALLMVGSLLALATYGLPIVLRSKILAIIEQQTSRKASLEKVQFTLLPLSIELQNFSIQEADGKLFAGFDSFYVTVNSWQSVKQRVVVIDKLAVVKPIVRVIKEKNGKYNFDNLFKSQVNNQQHTPLFPLTIGNLSLSEGKVEWEDQANKETIQSIKLTVENLSTAANKKCQLSLQLSLDSGGQLNWQGEASLNPLLSNGHIELNALKLPHLLTLSLPEPLAFSLNGNVLFNTDYYVSYVDQHLNFTADKAKMELQDFQYAEKDSNPILIKTPEFIHETDLKITYADSTWLFTANKSKVSLRDFEFSQLTPTKTFIKAPKFTHETDVKISYAHDTWQFFVNNTKVELRDSQLVYSNITVKVPETALETAIDIRLVDDKVLVSTKQGKLNSRGIQLFEQAQDKSLIDIADLALNGVDFTLNEQQLAIESLLAKDADFRTWLNPKGIFNYQTLFTPAKTTPTISTNELTSTPLAIKINTIALTNFGTTFEDKTQTKPVMVTLKPIDFKLTAYSNKTGVKLPFQLMVGINKTGSIQVNGDTVVEPFATNLSINAKAINLEPFQSYLEKIAHLDIIDGQLTTTGKLAVAMPTNQPLDLKFTGDSSISQLITRDQKFHKDFITWKTLTLKALSVDLQKNSYTADTLIIDKPYTRVTIKKDKSVNFSDIFIADPEPSKIPTKASVQPPAYFKLANIQIIDGSSDFADNSLILPFAAQIKGLDGGASDISSDQKSTIKLSLKGNAYDLSPVDIDGHISPYLGDYDLNLNFKGMPMPLISPYMVQFAGYKVEKGKLTLGLKYKVVNEELTASNSILIDQFELGEKVDNPKAVSLPLEFAVALLKDSDGKIKINVPITGSLNNPQFDMGEIIVDALENTLSKIISSPFRAIASLADTEEDMSTISFSAGNAILDKTQQEKLAALAKILKERPVLILDIKGTAFQTQDWPALREAALYDQLKKIRANEINKQANTKILAEYVKLSDSDYKRLLAELFIETFPKLAKKSLLGTPELIDSKAGDFYEVAKQQLSTALKREQPRLKKLAAQRAQAIASYLVQKSGVANEQVFILDPSVDSKRDNNEIASLLSLKAN